MSNRPIQPTSLLVATVALGMTIAQIVNHGMAGQALWLRMLIAAASAGLVTIVFGSVWFAFWRTSWCKYWHAESSTTQSDSMSMRKGQSEE